MTHPRFAGPTHAATARLRGAVLAIFLAALTLSGCAERPPRDDGPVQDQTGYLFGRAYAGVMEYYVEPRTAKDVALPALQRLSSLDPDLTIAAPGNVVVLRDGSRLLRELPQPAAPDARGWGTMTASLVADARRASPKLAAATEIEIERTMLSGLTTSLDRFSRYATAEAAREEHATREGFEGIGASIKMVEDGVELTAIAPESPADRAGLKAEDRLVEIDGVSLAGLSREEIVARLRGPAGSRVTLRLTRNGVAQPLRRTLIRAYVVVPTVTAERDGGVITLHVSSFNQHTTESLRESFNRVRRAIDGRPQGIVIDMRGNPGGFLDQAISVADLFMDGGRIVSTRGRLASTGESFDATAGDIAAGIPIVVLVNGGSASAAEIVAAALQDSGRAIVVGSSSYGKGTVQTQLPLPNDGELTLTSAHLYAPAGYSLHEHGIVPNLCTAGTDDDVGALAALLKRGAAVEPAAETPRATLDEAGWASLRQSCPGERVDHKIELDAAKRLLADPKLFAHLVHPQGRSVAAGPSARLP